MNIKDNITHPKHYEIEGYNPIVITERLPYSLGNVFKYLWRRKYKGQEYSDLSKALWYIGRAINQDTLDIMYPEILKIQIKELNQSHYKNDALINTFIYCLILLLDGNKQEAIFRLKSISEGIAIILKDETDISNIEIRQINKGL